MWANQRSEVGRKALRDHQSLFRIEREIEELPSNERQRPRQRKPKPVPAVFHRWLLAQRLLVPPGSATIKATDHLARCLSSAMGSPWRSVSKIGGPANAGP